MATLPVHDEYKDELISVREYLRTSFSPDCEYVDGRIEERNVGEKWHSILQKYLTMLFGFHEAAWGIVVYPELRTKVSGTKFRIPDVLVTRAGVQFEHVLDSPPLIAIEILSPDDRLSDLQRKISEYLQFGIEHVWIFDPQRKIAWRADEAGMHVTDGELTVPGTKIRVVLSEAWEELDRV
jgi:Uma2 family endonuclease